MHTVMLVVAAPLTNLILLASAWWIASQLSKWIPEGRIKRILYKKL